VLLLIQGSQHGRRSKKMTKIEFKCPIKVYKFMKSLLAFHQGEMSGLYSI